MTAWMSGQGGQRSVCCVMLESVSQCSVTGGPLATCHQLHSHLSPGSASWHHDVMVTGDISQMETPRWWRKWQSIPRPDCSFSGWWSENTYNTLSVSCVKMRVFWSLVKTLLVTLPSLVTSHSRGAPSQVCSTLEPGHGVGGGDHSDLPYKLTLSESDEDSIAISITGAGFLTSKQFKGFIIQVRSSERSHEMIKINFITQLHTQGKA